MTGQDHGRHFIAELFVGKAFSGLGITRLAHQIEQIAVRRAVVLADSAALGHQHADKTRPSLAKSRARKILRTWPAQRQQQIEKMRPRQSRAVLHHELAQLGAMAGHAE